MLRLRRTVARDRLTPLSMTAEGVGVRRCEGGTPSRQPPGRRRYVINMPAKSSPGRYQIPGREILVRNSHRELGSNSAGSGAKIGRTVKDCEMKGKRMKDFVSRRQFLGTSAVAVAGLALPSQLLGAKKKSLLVFTKSSGFEHQVVKRVDGHPSILEDAVTALGKQHGFDVTATKDGQIFDSKDFHKYAAVLFYTTGDLTKAGTDKNPPMSPQGKKALLDAVHGGLGFVGVHAASDTFHTSPTLPTTRIGILRTGNNLIPTFECWAGSSSSTEALPGCRPPTLS